MIKRPTPKIDIMNENGNLVVQMNAEEARKWLEATINSDGCYKSSYAKKIKIELEFEGCFPIHASMNDIMSENANVEVVFDNFKWKTITE